MNKKVILASLVLLLLTIGIGAGVYFGVKNNQDIRSKATSTTGSGWPQNPMPTDGQTGVDLSPTFNWTYETPDNTNCNPVGSYANLYLWNCSAHDDSCLIGFASKSSDTQSIYSISASEVHPYDFPGHPNYSKSIAPLDANKQYWWYVTPKACGVLHFEENKAWKFTTGAGVTPPPPPTPVAACQKVTPSKDLSTVKIGDTVTFTGYGTLSNQAADDSIDMIRFAIASTSGTLTKDVNTTLDSAGVWKATLDYVIKGASSYTVTIQAHWKSKNQWLP